MLAGKITTRITNSQRFNVVDGANLKRTIEEQNLQLSGILDHSTVVEVGKLAGVQKFIIGNFTGNIVEHHPPKYDDAGQVKEKAYYQATVGVTIRGCWKWRVVATVNLLRPLLLEEAKTQQPLLPVCLVR